MLVLAGIVTLAGCASTPTSTPSAPQNFQPHAAAPTNPPRAIEWAEPDRAAKSMEATLVEETLIIGGLNEPRPSEMPPIDSGAARFVEAIRLALPSQFTTETGRARVSVSRLRNQSRSTLDEFQTLQRRLIDLCAPPAKRMSLDFVTIQGEPVDYELCGTAYLITAEGSDQWEIYFQLHPSGNARETLWSNEAPIRMMRQQNPQGDGLRLPMSFK